MESVLLKVIALLYLLATVGYVSQLVFFKSFFSRFSASLLLAGFVLQTAALGLHFYQTGYPAVTQLREALSLYSWLMVGIFLLVQLKYRLEVLGAIVAPLVFLMVLSSVAFDKGTTEIPPPLKTYWLPLHVTLAFLGNAVFALAFGVSLVYLLQEHQLKNKRKTALTDRLPSLESLDRLNYTFLIWGFPLMTLGILTGSLWAGIHWGNYWSWEPRQITSAITWLLYGGLLHGRITAGLRGKKAAVWTMVGFVVVLGYFLWGDMLFPSRHAGRFE